MNSLSTKEIETQLLFFCRESLKHIVLESRCGISLTPKILKHSISNEALAGFKNNSPLLCIYKKAKPNIYSSKYSKSWDDSTFKKEVVASSNALMTLSLLECTKYYDLFYNTDTKLYNLSKLYKALSKLQLEFYYNYLRNNEGFFVDKKNGDTPINSEFNLIDKDRKYKFSDQAYMMLSYNSYSIICSDDSDSSNYENFSLEILSMFLELKEEIYNLPLEECCKICFCFNIMYEQSKNEDAKQFLIDICEFILSEYYETNPSLSNMETVCMLAINLIMCYHHTNIALFKDSFIDIIELFKNIYNEDSGLIQKPGDKKEIKYTSIEISLYLVNMILYQNTLNPTKDINNQIYQVYKQYLISSGLITSFPEAPNLDSYERYTNLSLKSDDLIEEISFRMPNAINPDLSGLASIFLKNVSYCRKKESFSGDKISFDSNRNMFLFFTMIHLLLPNYIDTIITPKKTNDIDAITTSQKPNDLTNSPDEDIDRISPLNLDAATSTLKDNIPSDNINENNLINDIENKLDFDIITQSDTDIRNSNDSLDNIICSEKTDELNNNDIIKEDLTSTESSPILNDYTKNNINETNDLSDNTDTTMEVDSQKELSIAPQNSLEKHIDNSTNITIYDTFSS